MGKYSIAKFNRGKHRREEIILRQANVEGNIVFGAQSIKRKLGVNARRTRDYDLFSKTPKKSAVRTENSLDKLHKSDDFYTKKGTNASTYKVKFKGKDLKPNTGDDVGVADYTITPSPTPKTFNWRGAKFRVLKEELAAKKRLLRTPEFAFRKKKDLEDLKRIKRFGRI